MTVVFVAPVEFVVVVEFVVSVWDFGLLTIAILGCCGGTNAWTPTFAWSVPSRRPGRRLAGRVGDVLEVRVDVLLRARVGLGLADRERAQIAVAVRRERIGDRDVLRVTSPVFLTVIVNVAVPPMPIVWESGSLMM